MRWSVIKSLFLTNLLYVNPQKTNLQRAKVSKKKKNLQNRMLLILLSANILGIILVPLQFIFTNFSYIADKLMNNSIAFSLFLISIIMQTFYSIFYEDSLTKDLTTMPVSDNEVFYSRILTLLFYNFTFIYGFTAFNIIAHIKFYEFNLYSLFLVTLYSFSTIILASIIAISLLVSITKIKFISKYMQVVKFAISLLGAGSVIFFVSSVFSSQSENISLGEINNYKGDFVFNILARTLDTTSIFSILLLVTLAGLSLLLLNILIKNYLEHLNSQSTVVRKQSVTQEAITSDSRNIFRKITIKSFTNGNLIRQNIISSLFIPVVFSNAIFQARERGYFTNSEFDVLPTAIIIAIMCSFIMTSYAAFPALSISVDYKNYEMLKTMPVNLKNYLLSKLYISLALQLTFISVVYIIILIILNPSFLVGVISYLVFLITTSSYLIHLFIKDLRKPFIGWANITQLTARGDTGGAKALIKLLLFAIVATITITINVYYTIFLPNYWYVLSLAYIFILLILAFVVIKRLFTEINKIQ